MREVTERKKAMGSGVERAERRLRTARGQGLALAAAFVVAGALTAAPAALADSGPRSAPAADSSYAATTGVGVHNAYEKAKYPYFADALDSGAAMLELDVWTNVFGGGWRVSHSNPIGNDNNCENAQKPEELRTKARNQRLDGCLADMKAWHDAHPGHRPVLVKVELKDGFQGKNGRGPADLDALLRSKLGDALYRPGQLAEGSANLDEAVQKKGWPGRADLAGKFIVELIPGTVEQGNPADTLWTDREYATHLRDLAAAGRLADAGAFPAVLGAASGDPRTRYQDASIRPWFVLFDGDASVYAGGSVDTKWYADRRYLVVMSDAHNVPPAMSATDPTETQARDRVSLLAGRHASIVSSDWYPLPGVLSTVVPRG
ncbi:phosphatidylinositol-specific phospholipase C domain-containing protein [Streptomyces flavofungini]|uniref:phosphatidylinositol-specific phospholipase C domain-containing protein n=1 Tax=Streptomyces flavofungini TaxID=68200 RepID=UPI001E4D8432|nr:phosphatidylinositol-specific phospholipase C domain-containing protein [Streptomyces flavofungini]